jgi:hypothetical protein
VAELNGDTFPDLVTANNGVPDSVSVLLGNGAGAFAEAAGSPVPLAAGADPRSIAVAELEGKLAKEESLRAGITCGPVTVCGQP